MAEYYAVLKKAVGGLEPGASELRRTIYDKARNALIGQLKAIDPPLPAAEISRQRLELEEAIRRVERENVTEAQNMRTVRAIEQEIAPISPQQSLPKAPPPQSAQPAPVSQSSPQDVFRRAIRQADTRPAGPPTPVERPSNAARPSPQAYGGLPPVETARPVPPEYRPEPRYTPQAIVNDSRLAPDYTSETEWRQPQAAPSLAAHAYDDPRERPRKAPRAKAYRDEDEKEIEIEGPGLRRSRLPTMLLLLLILAMIGGLGALGWSQRAVIADLVAGMDDPPSSPAGETTSAPAQVAASKEPGRLPGTDGAASTVRSVDEGSDPAAPPVAGDPIADAISSTPTVAPPVAPGNEKAVLYEEPLDAATAAAGVVAIDANVGWRFVESGSNGPEVEATIEVPERSMRVRLVIRRNTDATLPASHLVEVVFDTPADFPGRGIRGVPRIVLKSSEDERGEPLVGAAAKVADGFFWIALSAASGDVTRNLALMRDRGWIDLPVVYELGQRAILTFEKGSAGTEAFQRAFAAWETG